MVGFPSRRHPRATATGAVTFMEGTTILGTATLDASGNATLSFLPPAGHHAYTALYAGDTNTASSTSRPAHLSVPAAPHLLTLTCLELLQLP